MALIDRLRRRAIRDHTSAGTFIDERSFFLAQACVQDYCRLRAAEGVDALFADPKLVALIDKACWEAYPRALTMVGTVAEAALRRYAGERSNSVLFGLIGMILENFDLRPAPRAIGDADWRAARADIERSLSNLAGQPPKGAEVVAQEHAPFCLAIMPLHPKLGPDDFPALRNQLRLSLLNVEEAFAQRANLLALTNELGAGL
jgi:hypothetical protein